MFVPEALVVLTAACVHLVTMAPIAVFVLRVCQAIAMTA